MVDLKSQNLVSFDAEDGTCKDFEIYGFEVNSCTEFEWQLYVESLVSAY